MAGLKQSGRTDTNVAAIVAHPLRARCLTYLAERTASPNELKTELGVPLGDAAYHVKRLHDLGAIELVDTRQVRGAVEHFYRANMRPEVTDEEVAKMTPRERQQLAEEVCLLAFADASRALEEGTFCSRSDYYAIRTPLNVDETGWGELNEAFSEMLERVTQIQADSAGRMANDPKSKPIRAAASAMFFEMPESGKGGK